MSTYYNYIKILGILMTWRDEELATGSRIKASRINKVMGRIKARKQKYLNKWWI